MRKAGLTFAVVLVLGLSIWAPFQAQGQPAHPGASNGLTFEPVVVESVTLERADRRIIGGFYGGHQGECGAGTEAYLEVRNADDSLAWRRCHHSSPAGHCEDIGGQPLFGEFTSIDPAYILASSLHGADVAPGPEGEIVVTGELFLGCHDGAEIAVSRGAFLALFDADGNLIADAYVGDQPGCPAIDDAVCCRDLCDDTWVPPDGGGGDGSCSGRGVAFGQSGIAFTGWCQQPDRLTGWDLAVGRFTHSLDRLWLFQDGLPGKDVGQGVAIDDQGVVFAAGYATIPGRRRDAFLSQHDAADGHLEDIFLAGGGKDDEGRRVALDANDDPVLEGYVTGRVQFGVQTLGVHGAGPQEFSAEMGRGPLRPIEVEMNRDEGPPEVPPEPTVENKHQPPSSALTIVDCTITIGSSGGGCAEVLETAGDGSTLNLIALQDADGKEAIELEIDLLPAPWPFELQSIGMKVQADFCYTATLWLNGLLEDVDLLIGQQDICPAERPRLHAEIPQDLSNLLGFDGTTLPTPGEVLKVLLRFDFGIATTCPAGLFCDSHAKDASVDELEVEVEF